MENINKDIQKVIERAKAKASVQAPVPKDQIINRIGNYMLTQSNIPDSYLEQELSDLTLTSSQRKVCMQIIQAYKGDLYDNLKSGQGIYLWASGKGDNEWGTGTGKTSLAVILVKSIINNLAKYVYSSLAKHEQDALEITEWKTSVRRHNIFQSRHIPYFITGATYFQKLNDADRSEKERLKARARKALILIWDDYGTEKIEWYHDEVFALLNDRVNNNRPIIFTSNWELDIFANMGYKNNSEELKEIGGRLASRIASMVSNLVFRMEGKDWRKEELKNIDWQR
ncbi:hypothetical protein JCM16358_16060 [Halanaerocella petrolearia]